MLSSTCDPILKKRSEIESYLGHAPRLKSTLQDGYQPVPLNLLLHYRTGTVQGLRDLRVQNPNPSKRIPHGSGGGGICVKLHNFVHVEMWKTLPTSVHSSQFHPFLLPNHRFGFGASKSFITHIHASVSNIVRLGGGGNVT